MADGEEYPPYGPVPEEKRRPARHWEPEGRLQGRPMLSPPVPSIKLLNRSTQRERPERAAGEANRMSGVRPDPGPTRQRAAPPAAGDVLRQIDEEESARLNAFDGYNPVPPRPREGSGLQLRPQHDDINEYFTGPKWDDPRGTRRMPPYVAVAETRPIPPPAVVKKPRPRVRHSEIGEKADRPPPPPPAVLPPPREFRARNILFEGYTLLDAANKAPARFRGKDYLVDIQHVTDILRDHPEVKVRIRASVGGTGFNFPIVDAETRANWIKLTMIRRGQAVSNQLKARGIDPARISTELGEVGSRAEDRSVEFIFDVPAP